MGLKKRGKVSAEFSMSSLTDIIFLLLIFFMLTSSLVSPNALNLKMPGKTNIPSSTSKKLQKISITKSGSFLYEGVSIKDSALSDLIKSLKGERFIIAPSKDAPVEKVVRVMDLAMRYKVETVLAAVE